MAEGQRRGVRRGSGVDHDIRRVGGGQLRLPAPHLARDEGTGAPRHTAERHPQRSLELHERGEGERGRDDTGRRLRMQLDHAEREPGQGDGVYEVRGREDHIRSTVEQLLGDSRLPLGAHHRRYLPSQASSRSVEGGGLQGHRDTDR